MQIIFTELGNNSKYFALFIKFFFKDVFFIRLSETNEKVAKDVENFLILSKIYPLNISKFKDIKLDEFIHLTIDPQKNSENKLKKIINLNMKLFFNKIFLQKDNKNIEDILYQKIFSEYIDYGANVNIWKERNKKKIILIGFSFLNFLMPDLKSGIYKFIIPVSFLKNYKLIVKFFSSFFLKKNTIIKNQEKKNFTVGYLLNKGLKYNKLYNKNFYYSSDKNSKFNIKNILHVNVDSIENYSKINFINYKSSHQIFFTSVKTILIFLKGLFKIRSPENLIALFVIFYEYIKFQKFDYFLSKYPEVKIFLIDYDSIAPKSFLMAMKKNKINTISIQQRNNIIYLPWHRVSLDYYFVENAKFKSLLDANKNIVIKKKIIPCGSAKGLNIKKFINKNEPLDIYKIKKEKNKKIILALGHHIPNIYSNSVNNLFNNLDSAKLFLRSCINVSKLSQSFFLIIRYKNYSKMLSSSFLKEEIDEIHNLKNILLCKNYYEKYRNYKICAISDLVIAEYTSMVDECLSQKKAVIVHDFNNNLNSYAKNFFTYLPSKIFCSNSYDLESKVQDFFSNDGDLKSFFEDYFQKIEIFNTKEIINKNLEEIIKL